MAVAETVKAAAPKAPADWSIEVEAYRLGYYPQPDRLDAWLREPGRKFLIKNVHHFASEWMRVPGAPVGHLMDETGKAVEARSGKRIEVFGHGPIDEIPAGVPLTTVPNQVRDPLAQLNESAANQFRGR